MADTLQFREGDETWKRLRHRCRTDLYFLCEVILGYGEKIPMVENAHKALCRFAERRTGNPDLDNAQYQKIEVSRSVGKTCIVTVGRTIQMVLGNPDISILICNEKEQNAMDYLSDIKGHFETNQTLRALFPDIIPQDTKDVVWSATRINVKRTSPRKEPTISVIGVGGAVTGQHPDHIVVDDMLSREVMENMRVGSGQLVQQLNRWLHQLEPLLSNVHSTITIVGTRWWHGDSYEHVEEWLGHGETPTFYQMQLQLETGEKQTLPMDHGCQIYRVGDLAVFRRSILENGRSYHPARWPDEKLAKFRMTDPDLFASNMLLQPADAITTTFKPAWFKRYEWIDGKSLAYTNSLLQKRVKNLADLDLILYVDPGGFKKAQKGTDRARAGLVLVGATGEGQYLIIEAYSERVSFLTVIQVLTTWCRRYRVRKIKCEAAGQQAGFAELLRRDLRQAGVGIAVEEVTTGNQDKDVRILQLEPFFERGMVYIGSGPAHQDLQTQLEQFPKSTRKDLADALAYAAMDWAKMSGQGVKPEERQAKELATFRQRRGMIPGMGR